MIGPLAIVTLVLAVALPDDDPFRPGEVILESPTFRCLGVRWYGEGDRARRAAVALAWRPVGSAGWRDALPLFRVEGEKCEPPLPPGRALFAGSIFDLEPGTEVELRIRLEVPGAPAEERILRAATRREPEIDPRAPVLHVRPGDGGGSGTAADPFRGLAAAAAAARSGDVIDLEAGVYPGPWRPRGGEEGKPIVWRGDPGYGTVIDGGGGERAIDGSDLRHLRLDRLEIRRARWGIAANGASDLAVTRCRIREVETGFSAHRRGQRNLTITDCTIEGPSTWPRTKGIEDAEGVEVQGDGCVVARNRIRRFGDGISIFRGPSHGNDVYLNEITECTDDGIEMDYGGQNVRCFLNRCVDVFQGISVQPLHGGPCYVVRNVLHNIEVEPFKIHNGPSGILFFHNTVVKKGIPLLVWTREPFSNSVFRNNLFVGTGGGYAMEISPPASLADWDFDGFAGGPFRPFARWSGERYATFEDFRARSGIEAHAVLVDAAGLFASGLGPPEDPKATRDPAGIDPRPAPGGGAVDRGARLTGINDGFRGAAPDLGALEAGDPLPPYGPRPEGDPRR